MSGHGTPQVVRRPTQNELILQLLNDREWHTTREILRAVPCVVHSRIAELRKRGYTIEHDGAGGGAENNWYRLTGSPLDAASSCWGAASSGGNSPVGVPSPGTDGAAARLNQQLVLT